VKILEIIIIMIVFGIISSIISSVGKQQKRNAPPVSTKYKAPRAKVSGVETRGTKMTAGHDQRFKALKAKTAGTQGNKVRTVGLPMAYSPELYNSTYSTARQEDVPMDMDQAGRIDKRMAEDFFDDMTYSDDQSRMDISTPVLDDIERVTADTYDNRQPMGSGMGLSRQTLITGMIFSEILSPPRARRPYKRLR